MKGDFTRTTFDPKKHYSSVRMQQGRVQLDADWNEQMDIQAHLQQTEATDVIGPCGVPKTGGGFKIGEASNQNDLTISPGRIYVDGILCVNEEEVLFTNQPNLPGETTPPAEEAGLYLTYLDVWGRHITVIEDPDIREVALGGPDTATRTKTIWQVKLEKVTDADCSKYGPGWKPTDAESSGELRARAEPSPTDDGPCIVPPEAGYRRLENQLYRVEIHESGTLNGAPDDAPTFKWSRDNGSIVTKWEKQDVNDLTVSSTGRDSVLGFAPQQWVELTDDTHELRGKPGTLVKVVKVEGQLLTIDPTTATGSVDIADFSNNPKVRRWDSEGELTVEIPATNDGWIPLEDGVEINFKAGTYSTGDYWLIPARTITGDVLWPVESNQPVFETRHGIEHHYCALALLTFDGNIWTQVTDCRRPFPSLTEQMRFFHVGGTGQEAMPGEKLPQPLEVGVTNGQCPVEGAKVKFETVPDNGNIGGSLHAQGDSGPSVVVQTDAKGVVACEWELDTNTQHRSQRVIATWLTPAEVPVEGISPLAFNANLSIASQVAYDPSDCEPLAKAGASTVQEAIDQLCQLGGGTEPGIHIKGVFYVDASGKRRPLRNDGEIVLDSLIKENQVSWEIQVSCDQEIDTKTIKRPTCFVTLEMPFFPSDHAGASLLAGYQPLILAAVVSANENIISWKPTNAAGGWLGSEIRSMLDSEQIDKLLVHLTLKGNFIWTPDTPRLYLDGEALGTLPGETPHNLTLPSGDGRVGGDFEMWFWLVKKPTIGFIPNVKSVVFKDPKMLQAMSLLIDRGDTDFKTLVEQAGAEVDPNAPFNLDSAMGIINGLGLNNTSVRIGFFEAKSSMEALANAVSPMLVKGNLPPEVKKWDSDTQLELLLQAKEVDMLIDTNREAERLKGKFPDFFDGTLIRF